MIPIYRRIKAARGKLPQQPTRHHWKLLSGVILLLGLLPLSFLAVPTTRGPPEEAVVARGA